MKFLYFIYQLIIFLPIFIVATIITALTTIIGCTLGGSRFWGYYPGRAWSWLTCRLLLLPIKVEGREHLDPKASYVFVANHQGAMDIFLIYGFLHRNFKWMMKKSLKKIPLVGFACQKADFIFVDRGSQHGIKETIRDARRTLQDGMSMMVFPEGTRTFTGQMRPFSKGAFMLADELQLPVVPITINGSFQVLPRTKGFNFVCFHRMSLTIHQPIQSEAQGAENIKTLSQLSFDAINSSLTNY